MSRLAQCPRSVPVLYPKFRKVKGNVWRPNIRSRSHLFLAQVLLVPRVRSKREVMVWTAWLEVGFNKLVLMQ